jgi:pilus assembly protein FimV
MKKQLTAHVIFAATALASQQAWALGFGRAVSDAVLGQSLTFTVPLHVDPGEHIGLECITAQVYYGEAQLPSTQVRTDLQPGTGDYAWIVKVTANAPVAEPIVEIALSANCDRPFTRRFSLFADPPTLGATLPQIAPANTARTPPATAPAEATPAAGYSVAAPAAQAGASGAASARSRVVRKGPTMALANDTAAPPAAEPTRRHVVVADSGSARKPGPRAVPAPTAAETARLVLDPGVPHLKLDMEEPVIAPTPAASGATIGLSDIDDPDLRQLKALEQSIASIRNDSQLQHERADRLQAQLAQAQSHGDWAPWLLGLLAIAAAAIAALLWKLREQNRIAHSDWFNQSQLSVLPPAAPEPEPAVEPPPAAPVAAQRRDAPAPVAAPLEDALPELPAIDDGDARGVPVMPDLAATRPLDRQALAAAMAQDSTPRELSVEELLDLEQQADFFIALGQEDAAVDLLMSHLRSAGGQSPIPYTKLLEIYKRQGDRSAYERIRARFNRRFNAYAPDWDTGPSAGRSLEDYPDTLALLERAWGSPINAMAILEALLFKRDDTSELFDLPAYRDVLMLYSLARDLWQNGVGQGSAQIDVLLPLDDASDAGYPSAREVNERALPKRDGGLDLDSVDAEGDTAHGMLTSFELTGFDSGSRDGHLDLELPPGEVQVEGADVHVTLDELSLSPSAPGRPKAPPHEWHDSETPDSDQPTKR